MRIQAGAVALELVVKVVAEVARLVVVAAAAEVARVVAAR